MLFESAVLTFDEMRTWCTTGVNGKAYDMQPVMLLHDAQTMAMTMPVLKGTAADVDKVIAELEKHLPDLQKPLFLRFLEALYRKDYAASIETLTQYHDLHGSGPHAVLQLAQMHVAFRHWKLAVQAIAECIGIAQQVGDRDCLLRALALLTQVAQMRYSSKSLLQRCIATQVQNALLTSRSLSGTDDAKPVQVSSPAVDCAALLSLAEWQLAHASSHHVFLALQQCSERAFAYCLPEFTAQSHLRRAFSWLHYGYHALTRAFAEMQLIYYSPKSSVEVTISSLNLIASIPTIDSADAFELLSFGKELFPNAASHSLHVPFMLTHFSLCFRVGDRHSARKILAAFSPPTDSNLSAYYTLAEAQLALLEANYAHAEKILIQLIHDEVVASSAMLYTETKATLVMTLIQSRVAHLYHSPVLHGSLGLESSNSSYFSCFLVIEMAALKLELHEPTLALALLRRSWLNILAVASHDMLVRAQSIMSKAVHQLQSLTQ